MKDTQFNFKRTFCAHLKRLKKYKILCNLSVHMISVKMCRWVKVETFSNRQTDSTVKPVLSGHPQGMAGWQLTTGGPLQGCSQDFSKRGSQRLLTRLSCWPPRYACQTGSKCRRQNFYIELPYLCPNLNIYIFKEQYLPPKAAIYMFKCYNLFFWVIFSIYIFLSCRYKYFTQYFDKYVFYVKRVM